MKKNILVIDDSALMRRVISDIINSDERFHVESVASNGLEGLEVLSANPSIDLIILDINMPVMDGMEFLQALNGVAKKPKVIVVSLLTKEGANITMKCLEYGAFDFVRKPVSYKEARNDTFMKVLLDRIALALSGDIGEPESISSRPLKESAEKPLRTTEAVTERSSAVKAEEEALRRRESPKGNLILGKRPPESCSNKLVAMACSTGGPKSLQSVIPYIPKNLNAPVLLVQHMPKGFTYSLAERLNDLSELRVKEAENGEILEKGVVYIAQGGYQMKVEKGTDGKYRIIEVDEPARGGLKPCADIMYESIAELDFGEVTCVVLTGMGGDGSKGIQKLSQRKQKIYVIAQDEETCIVYGMPKMIYHTGLVNEVLPLTKIAGAVAEHVGVR